MASRSALHHLAASLAPRRADTPVRQATALLLHPTRRPAWSPRRDVTEVSTGRVWASRHPTDPRLLDAVVVASDRDRDGMVLAAATVAAWHVFGVGSLVDKPHRIDGYALPGTLVRTPLSDTHPAMVQLHGFAELDRRVDRALAETGLSWREYDNPDSARLPDGRAHTVVGLTVATGCRADRSRHIAAALAHALRELDPGTRLRWHPGRAPDRVTDPLYTAALRTLLTDHDPDDD